MDKEMIEGFIRYLQSYYGKGEVAYASTTEPNAPKMHMFQSEEAGFDNAMPALQDMGMGQAAPDMATQMNMMFPPGGDRMMN